MTARAAEDHGARALTIALGGHWRGGHGMACCPAHDDHEPSLSISTGRNGQPIVMCFAGCPQQAVVDALKTRGLWFSGNAVSEAARETLAQAAARNELKRIEAARRLWHQGVSIANSPAETYLRGRGLKPPFPPSLRFIPNLTHAPSGLSFPVMIAGVQRLDRSLVAVHRTYLSAEGEAKAAVSQSKMSLGLVRGGAVRLAAHDGELIVGEGIESTLSAMQASGLPGWAALSTSGLASLDLPPDVRAVTIAADNDINGAGQRAASAAAARWVGERRAVRVALPPAPGTDFNDLINQKMEIRL